MVRDSFWVGGVISKVQVKRDVMSPEQRRAAIVELLSRGVARWRAGQLVSEAVDSAEDVGNRRPISEISRDSLAERLEQTGRNAFLMELDPPYCDVIVDRFQRFTGKKAVLERTGESPVPVGAREENMR